MPLLRPKSQRGPPRPLSWRLPPDPLKPELPYCRGLSLAIRAHIPPPPFGFAYVKDAAPRPLAHWTDLDGMTQSEWCFQHPPINTPSQPGATVRYLHVLDEVACCDGRGAQVLRCSLSDSHDDRVYVAKIYDPLYYAYVESIDDVTWKADRDYGCEAAAYEELKKADVDGMLVPKYYGSWTFNMAHPARPQATRPVRMILMEWIPNSVTMQHLQEQGISARISPQHRLDILAKAMEVFSEMEFYGVKHEDFAPRNVLLVGPEIESRMPGVMLFDFNMSAVYSRPTCKRRRDESKLPISPQYLFWGESPTEFYEWTPNSHRSRRPIFLGWLKSCWENSMAFDGPPESLKDLHDFDEPFEFAPPSEDKDLSRTN
ncbi:Protein kinase-like domain protein [Fusarium austroafricanum]|uniref:non-specific serine/threonine protein kinase n=1 Tax=Fusarium austroafricanum TaxID=2364996 RepID=A0A8H4KA97_9HYPO|nr:Protein kinase-like domain protein [Fusarium austroafricanum]